MGKRILFTWVILFTFLAQSFAQSGISGRVTDASGEPLVGVNVLIKGTTTGTMTDENGQYSLANAKAGNVLVFSCIGFVSQEKTVGSAAVINVILQSDNKFLDEVVVVAYGTQKRKDLTGSMTEVKSDLVAIQNTSTISRTLEGSAPGLQVASVDAQPGYDMAIRLRGVSSTYAASAAALIVIDGVAQQMNQTYENPLSQLDPNDIASISVLKDAASTALYGSRAGNGVILITTKRGQEGRAKISFQARWGWNSIGDYNVNSIDKASTYYEYAWKSIYNSYRYGVDGTGAPGINADGTFYTNVNNPNHSDEEARLFASAHLFDYWGSETEFQMNNLNNNMAYSVPGAVYTTTGSGDYSSSTMSGAYLVDPNTGKINKNAKLLYDDKVSDLVFDKAFRQEYTVSASGGSEKMHYYVSLGYQDEPSYLISSSFKRYNGRTSMDAQVLDWLKIGTNVSYTKSTTRALAGKWGSRQIGGWSGSNPMYNVKGSQPIVPVYQMNEDGSYALDDEGNKILNLYNESYSPLGANNIAWSTWGAGSDYMYIAKTNIEQQDIAQWTSRSYATATFLKYFSFTVNFNMDEQNWRRTMYWNHVSGRGRPNGGIGKKTYLRRIINTQQLLNYSQDFGLHHVDVMLGHEYEDLNRHDMTYGSSYELIAGYPISGNFVGRYVNQGGESSSSPGFSRDIYRTESYLSRANYNYAEKYYLSASYRRDGSSKFTSDNRWGDFWSVGGAWRFSEESFMSNFKDWLDNAKLRVSYGVTGNANGLTNYYLNHQWWYSVSTWLTSSNGTGVPSVTSISDNGLVRTDLTWEKIHQLDAGLDFSVLKSRITGAIDYYNHLTVNSLFNQAVSPLASNGNTTLLKNAAKLRNYGFELELDADIIRTRDLTLSIGLNGTHYRTILVDVPESQKPYWDETIDLPEGCWTQSTEDMAQAGTAGHAGRGIFYLRGEGKDYFNIYMPKYAGVDQNSGLPLYWHRVTYKDVYSGDHGGRYANYEVGDNVKTNVSSDASYYEQGSATPDWIGGLTVNLKWKNFDVQVVSAYQFGGKFFSMEYAQYLYRGSNYGDDRIPISKDLVGNTWTPDNTGAYYPMQWSPSANTSSYQLDGVYLTSNHDYTDMALFSATYFRLKNITIGYTLPKSITDKINMSGFRVFFSADNLLLFSAQKGVDPTMSIIGGKEVDTYTYPQMQTITLGVNLDF